jgi:cell fate (sporulation/competence/biofilm development) regulator YlbF (YheA/YmcA/DUF963 family)
VSFAAGSFERTIQKLSFSAMKNSNKSPSNVNRQEYDAHLEKLLQHFKDLREECQSFRRFAQHPDLHFPKYYLTKLEQKLTFWESFAEGLEHLCPNEKR